MSMLFSRQHTLMLLFLSHWKMKTIMLLGQGAWEESVWDCSNCCRILVLQEVRTEVQHRQDRLNSSTAEYAFEMNELYTHTEYTFFRGKDISAPLVYSMLLMVLLIVPAINISGMTNARMQERVTEIAVRKAYGASRISIMVRLFLENLLTVFLGGILGYLFSCVLVWLGRVWLFGSGEVELSGISLDGGLLLHPALFVLVFGVCVVFNLLSVLIPVWMVTHRNIATTIKGE